MANSIHLTVDPNRKTLIKQEPVVSNELSKSDNPTTLTTTSTTTVPICLPQEVTIHVSTFVVIILIFVDKEFCFWTYLHCYH